MKGEKEICNNQPFIEVDGEKMLSLVTSLNNLISLEKTGTLKELLEKETRSKGKSIVLRKYIIEKRLIKIVFNKLKIFMTNNVPYIYFRPQEIQFVNYEDRLKKGFNFIPKIFSLKEIKRRFGRVHDPGIVVNNSFQPTQQVNSKEVIIV